ncbi:MAG: glycosyltransferase family 4 protein [Planctomycetes bacterium]|nr:glycosyltransferase family 4 protein [Planctomycetota bacterium]
MMAPLRIALVVDPITALIGGGRHPLELSAALAARGHEVRVFGLPPDWLSAPAAPLQEHVERRLGPSVMSFEPEGIVAYDARSPAAWIGARVARRRDVPLVLVEADGWTERSPLQRTLWSIGERLWGGFVRRAAEAVMALDPQSRSSSLARGFEPERIDVVPPGVDLERFRPGLASEELGRRHIGGRILSCRLPRDAGEQHELLIEAFARTVGQRSDWSLVLIGDGQAAPRFRVCADRRGVGSRVHFLEYDLDALPGLLANSTLHAAPQDARHVTTDLARALACGVPVVAVDSPRVREWIRHDEHGLIARSGDAESLTLCLREAAMSPERRKRWGSAGRRLAEERFGWDAVAARFEDKLGRDRQPAPDESDRLSLRASTS